jgi:hypothetical protein
MEDRCWSLEVAEKLIKKVRMQLYVFSFLPIEGQFSYNPIHMAFSVQNHSLDMSWT